MILTELRAAGLLKEEMTFTVDTGEGIKEGVLAEWYGYIYTDGGSYLLDNAELTKETEQKIKDMIKKTPFEKYFLHGLRLHELPQHGKSNSALNFFKGQFAYCGFCELFAPVRDVSDVNFLYVWPNFDARMKGVKGRTRMKLGRAIRQMYPNVTDVQVETMVNKYKEYFAEKEFTLCEGEESKDFLHAYTSERGEDRNFSVTEEHKRICDSCMRYDADYFDHSHHPVEAFASGDFYMLWAEDSDGYICGRTVVCKVTETCGPIYATCRGAIDFLENTLKDRGITYGGFEGAKLINNGGDKTVFGPYFDFEPTNVTLIDDGERMVVDPMGAIHHEHTGWYESSRCEWCDDIVDQEDLMYIESVDQTVCYCCREREFFESDYDREEYLSEDMTVVKCWNYGRVQEQLWTIVQAEDHAYFVEEDSEYWEEEDTYQTFDGKYVSHKMIHDGDYFICDVSGEAYPWDMQVETDQYEKVGSTAIDLSEYTQDENGIYQRKEVA